MKFEVTSLKAFVILQNDYNGSEELIKELQTFCKMKLRHTNIQERLNLLTTYLRQIQEKSDVLNYATQKLQSIITKLKQYKLGCHINPKIEL